MRLMIGWMLLKKRVQDEDEAFMDAVLDDVVNEFASDNEGTTRDENSIAQAVAAVAAATSPELDVESCRRSEKAPE